MNVPATNAPITVSARSWPQRLRLALGVALIWVVLQYLVNLTLMAPGLDRPATLAAANHPLLAGLAVTVILLAGGYVGSRVAGRAYPERGLLVAALALACWAIPAGTMTDWLVLANGQTPVGPPTGGPYWPLVPEYVWLLTLMLAVATLSELPWPWQSGLTREALEKHLRRVLALDVDARRRANGVMALLLGTLVTGVLMLILTGPATAGETLRGQVYFAVAVSSACGTFLAHRVVSVDEPIWYWPAPILAGLLGVLVAAVRPALLLNGYNHLNSIPAWGLARPLPIEMVGVGVAASLWALRASQRAARGRRA